MAGEHKGPYLNTSVERTYSFGDYLPDLNKDGHSDYNAKVRDKKAKQLPMLLSSNNPYVDTNNGETDSGDSNINLTLNYYDRTKYDNVDKLTVTTSKGGYDGNETYVSAKITCGEDTTEIWGPELGDYSDAQQLFLQDAKSVSNIQSDIYGDKLDDKTTVESYVSKTLKDNKPSDIFKDFQTSEPYATEIKPYKDAYDKAHSETVKARNDLHKVKKDYDGDLSKLKKDMESKREDYYKLLDSKPELKELAEEIKMVESELDETNNNIDGLNKSITSCSDNIAQTHEQKSAVSSEKLGIDTRIKSLTEELGKYVDKDDDSEDKKSQNKAKRDSINAIIEKYNKKLEELQKKEQALEELETMLKSEKDELITNYNIEFDNRGLLIGKRDELKTQLDEKTQSYNKEEKKIIDDYYDTYEKYNDKLIERNNAFADATNEYQTAYEGEKTKLDELENKRAEQYAKYLEDIQDDLKKAEEELKERQEAEAAAAAEAAAGGSGSDSSGGVSGGSSGVSSSGDAGSGATGGASQAQTEAARAEEAKLKEATQQAKQAVETSRTDLFSIFDGTNTELSSLKETKNSAFDKFIEQLKTRDPDIADEISSIKTNLDSKEQELDGVEKELANARFNTIESSFAMIKAQTELSNLQEAKGKLDSVDSSNLSQEKQAELTDMKSKVNQAIAEKESQISQMRAQDNINQNELEAKQNTLSQECTDLKRRLDEKMTAALEKDASLSEYKDAFKTADTAYSEKKIELLNSAKEKYLADINNYKNAGEASAKAEAADIASNYSFTTTTTSSSSVLKQGLLGGRMAGMEGRIEELCQKYGINDPKLIVAIARVETGYGSAGVGLSCNNPMSYRASGDKGKNKNNFGIFSTLDAGLEAGIRNLSKYTKYNIASIDINHIDQIAKRYNNGSQKWINDVKKSYNDLA